MNKRFITYVVVVVLIVALGAFAYVRYVAPPSVSIPEQSSSLGTSDGQTVAPISTSPAQQSSLRTVILDGQTIHVSIADTDALRQLGLGGRAGLAPDEGMLFIFPRDGIYAFWMKDMRFSIDMIWLADDGSIVYMAQNVSPDTYPKDFVPSAPARYVLELPAGYAKTHDVKIGDFAQL
jgi:uncharacterized membrane protein (UPF0127 family)